MLTNQDIKHIKSLGIKKNRVKHQLFVVEGPKGVQEFLDSDWQVDSVYASDQWFGKEAIPVTDKELERISFLQTPNKVLAVVKIPSSQFPIDGHTILALDGISDPGNLGTIIRLADWFGVKHICCSPNVVDCFNPKVVQATMGSLARVNLHYHPLVETLSSLNQYDLYGTVLNGKPFHSLSKSSKKVLVFGNESRGVSKDVLAMCHQKISIPKDQNSKAESLNVAMACGICLSAGFSGEL